MLTHKRETPDAATGNFKLAAQSKMPAAFGDKRDVAALARVSTRTIDNFLAQGMPHLKLGTRRTRFDMDEVRAWLKEKFGMRRLR